MGGSFTFFAIYVHFSFFYFLSNKLQQSISVYNKFLTSFCKRPCQISTQFIHFCQSLTALTEMSRSVVLNNQAPWTTKSQKNIPRTPKVSICTTCGPLNLCKRGVNWYKTLLLWSLRTPEAHSTDPRSRSTFGFSAHALDRQNLFNVI